MRGEGDINRHLQHLGYVVSHVQKPLDELDFTVRHVSADLRDGIRLGRLVEMLTHQTTLLAVRFALWTGVYHSCLVRLCF